MPSSGEIKQRMSSIREIEKVTNAMKVVSASKLKRARNQLAETEPFFLDVEYVMEDILSHSKAIESHFFYKRLEKPSRKAAVLVLTGDKGLSGEYDNIICKKAEQLIAGFPENTETVVLIAGRMGREYFRKTNYDVDEDFIYPLRNPTVNRARDIATQFVEKFNSEEYDDIYVVYTHLVNSLKQTATVKKLLPLNLEDLKTELNMGDDIGQDSLMNYEPGPHEVFKVLVSKYLTYVVYGCFVEAFTSEQSARMNAMGTASDNAESVLDKLNLDYNRARQAAITQEISEIVGGAASV